MILLFLGSWRSTLIIAISIPLSILSSILALAGLHETINIMTLGGLALAVGILVDDATVTIENIERHIEMGMPLEEAIFEGAAQISVPALVSTLCICIVFLPMFFLNGVPRYLFVPLAEAVVFAMLASYVLSRTLVPTLAKYLLESARRTPRRRIAVEPVRGFPARLRARLSGVAPRLLGAAGERPWRTGAFSCPAFCWRAWRRFCWSRGWGRTFSRAWTPGRSSCTCAAPTGMRIEETARLCDLVEASIRRSIPERELDGILDNIGLPYSPINLTYSNSAPIGSEDADILVTLRENHRPTSTYVEALAARLPEEFPEATFRVPARRHGQPDSEFRAARAHRRADRRTQYRRQPAVRRTTC